jgi:hypothetical protein
MIFIFPGPRQQFIEAVDGMPVDHAREHIAQVGVGFDAVEFAGLDQRADDCPSIAATVGRGLIVPGVRRAKSWSDIRFIHWPGRAFWFSASTNTTERRMC